ncbi:DUF7697 family protein [Roseinatronobacter sp.]
MRLGGQLRVSNGRIIGWDMSAALALGRAMDIAPHITAALLPIIEPVMARKFNEQTRGSHE